MQHDARFLIDLALRICTPLCKYKNDFQIDRVETIGSIMLNVRSNGADFPKLMGAKRKLFTALNLIFTRAGERLGKDVNFQVEEPAEIKREFDARFEFDQKFDRQELMDLLFDTCTSVLGEEFRLNPVEIGQWTTIEIYPHPKEGIDSELAEALDTVFHIWGNAKGRKIKVECADKCEARPA